MQWNCRSILNKQVYLPHLLKNYNIDILCLCETFLNNHQRVSFPGYNCIMQNRNNRKGGGLAIILSYNLKYRVSNNQYPEFIKLCEENGLEIIIMEIQLTGSSLHIFSLYNPPGQTRNSSRSKFWNNFFLFCNKFKQILICGDFNAKNSMWSNQEQRDSEGKNIESGLKNTNFMCLNNKGPTWLSKDLNSRSSIDLTFISSNLFLSCNWQILDYSYDSDHFPVTTHIQNISEQNNKCRPRMALNKVDWNNFDLDIQNKKESLTNTLNKSKNYEQFIETYKNSLIKSGAKIIYENKSKKFPTNLWWDESCSEIIINRKKLFLKYKLRPSLENLKEYEKEKTRSKKILKGIRQEKFRTFCNSLNKNSGTGSTWRIIKNFKNKRNMQEPSKMNSNTIEKDIINEAINKFKNKKGEPPELLVGSNELGQVMRTHLETELISNTTHITGNITINEYEAALKMGKQDSAPGPDLITNKLLLKSPHLIHESLRKFFNYVLESKQIPKDWKRYFVIFIPKIDRKGVRPISLASCVLKLFERIVYGRLEWWIENKKLLPNFQSGFRKSRSVLDTVTTLVANIQRGFSVQEKTGAIFLDIVGAYDNVNTFLLAKDLIKMGIPSELVEVIYNITKTRYIEIYHEGTFLDSLQVNKGLPQGSSLSPLLFNLYLTKIKDQISKDTKILQFADDIAIYVTKKDNTTIINTLNKDIQKIRNYLAKYELEISPAKTKACIFAHTDQTHKISNQNLSIKLGDLDIELVKKVKYLGFSLDYNLSWKTHINEIKEKCSKNINILKTITGIKWGAHPNNLLMAYKGLIRSNLDWGCHLFHNSNKKALKTLDNIQSEALRLALGVMKTTPIIILLDMAKESNLSLRRDFLQKKYLIKLFSFKEHLTKSSLLHTLNHLENSKKKVSFSLIDNLKTILQDCKNIVNFKLPGHLNYPLEMKFHKMDNRINLALGQELINKKGEIKSSSINNKFSKIINQNYKDSILAFTDGSKLENKTGFAVLVPNKNLVRKAKVDNRISNTDAEALAILNALSIAERQNYTKITICTDSQYTLKSLKGFIKKNSESPLTYKIKNSDLKLTKKGFTIEYLWIPSHSGIQGNENVDRLAKEATNLNNNKQGKCYSHNLIKEYKNKATDQIIQHIKDLSRIKGKSYFMFKNKIWDQPWFSKLNWPRDNITLINRIRSGHTKVNSHLFRMGIVDSEECSCGHKTQDVQHLLFYCTNHREKSDTLSIKLYETYPDMGQDPFSIAFSNKVKCCKLIGDFVGSLNLNI